MPLGWQRVIGELDYIYEDLELAVKKLTWILMPEWIGFEGFLGKLQSRVLVSFE
jgi:hypothetical protein